MLLVELTENGAGVFVSGDYEDLYFLREAVRNVAGDRTSYEGYEYVHSVVQHFVFELLHAYRAERDSFMTRCDTPSYKFKMLLPEAIFVADALNDYIILAESDAFYINTMTDKNSSLAGKIRERFYIDKAFIRFFQASVWNAVRNVIGEERFESIKPYRDYEAICENKDMRYKGYCREWIDILNIRYINNENSHEDFTVEVIKKLAERDEEYMSKERAMQEHAKDGNISLFLSLLDELRYPDEWEW